MDLNSNIHIAHHQFANHLSPRLTQLLIRQLNHRSSIKMLDQPPPFTHSSILTCHPAAAQLPFAIRPSTAVSDHTPQLPLTICPSDAVPNHAAQ